MELITKSLMLIQIMVMIHKWIGIWWEMTAKLMSLMYMRKDCLEEAQEIQRGMKMSEYEKLEWLHSQLSELIDGVEVDLEMMQGFVEDIREKHFDKNGEVIKEKS